MSEIKSTVGFAMCGSYCTHAQALEQLDALLARGYDVVPIVSERVWETDTRFGTAQALRQSLYAKCGNEVVHTIRDAEPLGPARPLSALVICPCTGNTLAKLAAGVTDSAVCMAAKAHLRSDRPLLIALASNDAMSANLQNIATLLNRKNVFFVPVRQDDPASKPHSLVADFAQVPTALEQALAGRQMRKLFL
ncbi:MAG: dipicolinate synthase subunit B [Clostridia bacterium]|jgi:dipicolinate synthase subunit B|nr:dipicolinate synthase subunit B [Clostridia bacterium]MBQ2256121.1 dipicolinate synthase subunit B [Clostridia bacterium]